MNRDYIRAQNNQFVVNGKAIIFRGYGLGNFLNLEHFMLGIPGIESELRLKIEKSYGRNRAKIFWEKYYECYVNESDFKFLKEIGINAVRIPFNYHHFEIDQMSSEQMQSDQDTYEFNPAGFKQIDRILSYCEKYKIYGILDLHAAPGGQNPDWHSDNRIGESLFWEIADFRKRVVALWKFIANHYKDNTWVAAYDLLNEPLLFDANPIVMRDFFEELVQEIRTVDSNHLLFIEGDTYTMDFRAFRPFTDKNIAATFHLYPMFFKELLSIEREKRKEALEEILFRSVTLDYIQDVLKMPVWCGETGALLDSNNREYQESLLEDFLYVLEKHKISWSIWSYKDARSMGSVHPAENSEWMNFSRRVCYDWNFWEDYNRIFEEVEDIIINKYPTEINQSLKRKLAYRMLCNYQYVLTERYDSIFSKIPFEELLGYLDSFKFENCEKWEKLINLIKKYTTV